MQKLTVPVLAGVLSSISAFANCPDIQGTFDCVDKASGDKTEQTFKTTVTPKWTEYEVTSDGQTMTLITDGQPHPLQITDIPNMTYVATCPAANVLKLAQSAANNPMGGGMTSNIDMETTLTVGTPVAGKASVLIESSGTWTTSTGMSGTLGPNTLDCVAR